MTITNGIDLSTKGGLTWIKSRSVARNHTLFDTNRGASKRLFSNLTNAEDTDATTLSSFNTNGFSLSTSISVNNNNEPYASWTFRKQPKFFDIVTYTGNGVRGRQISHSLGSVPGCVIVKRLDVGVSWRVQHRSLNTAGGKDLILNLTNAEVTNGDTWNSTPAGATVFTVGPDTDTNASAGTYVAYLFAHDAGGFGLTGTDNVISCGSYTGNGSTSGPTVTLGYEPQWLLIKRTDTTSNWSLLDTMRGLTAKGADDYVLFPNTTGAETYYSDGFAVLPTGFQLTATNTPINASGGTYIYIAIRRGPMKVPTDATKVFKPLTRAGTDATTTVSSVGFAPDLLLIDPKDDASVGFNFNDRLRGSKYLSSAYTNAEATSEVLSFNMNGYTVTGWDTKFNNSSFNYINYLFRRAPSFFDEVCYTGTGTNQTQNHNLGVEPELWISKVRNGADDWSALAQFTSTGCKYGNLNLDGGFGDLLFSNAYSPFSARPSSTSFSLRALASGWNNSGSTYVAYLFATCAGVSKVGSYTGTGTTKQIDCGFTGGARFVLIKKTSGTGSWYVWDSSRGIVSGNDPYLLLNSTAAEVTSTDYIDTYSAGFEISSTAPSEINENGGSFIFFAVS